MPKSKKSSGGWSKAWATGGIIATIASTSQGDIARQTRSTSKTTASHTSQRSRRDRGYTAQGGTIRKGNDTRGRYKNR